MEEEIISRVRTHKFSNTRFVSYPPASENALSAAELKLGLSIPHLLRRLYLEVGNGGFGPGYGIMGVEGGHACELGTLVSARDQIQQGADYLGLRWNSSILPFCDWGCNIFSCVDCRDPRYPIFQSEECNAIKQNYNLEQFFLMWIGGQSILDVEAYSDTSVDIINPFTRGKSRFKRKERKQKD